MTIFKEGTKEWLADLNNKLSHHICAFDPIYQAYQQMKKWYDEWDTLDELTKSALFTSIIIHYSRPFTLNRIAHGKHQYKTTYLKKAPGFDAELHKHIMNDIRDQIVAHHDRRALKTRIGHLINVVRVKLDNSQFDDWRIPLRTFAISKGVRFITSKEHAKRYLDHLTVCVNAIATHAYQLLGEINSSAQKYPDIQPRDWESPKIMTPENGEMLLPDADNIEGVKAKAPKLSISEELYAWRDTTLTYTPEAEYNWIGENGPASVKILLK